MNNYKIKLLAVLIIFISQPLNARIWIKYINEKVPSNYDLKTVSEVFDYEKIPFEKLLKKWELKATQEQQIQHYESYGFSHSLAKLAVEERLILARDLVKSKFLGVEDISPTLDSLDNRIKTMEYIAQLGHDRFKRLINKFDIKAEDDLFQCLCHSLGTIGTGLGYSPTPDKHCDTSLPCKGGNWGCVAKELPKNTLSWSACAKKYPTENGQNIFHRFSDHINISQKQQNDILKILQKRSKIHQKNCLPSLSKRSLSQMQSILKHGLAAEAANLADTTDNICEEALTVDLFLNANQSRYLADVAFEGITKWVSPIDLYAPNILEDKITSEIKSDIIEKALGNTIGGFIGKVNNVMSTKKLIEDEIKANKTDAIYEGASELFKNTSSWNKQQLKDEKSKYQHLVDQSNVKLSNLQSQYIDKYNKFYTMTMQKINNSVDARKIQLENELKRGSNQMRNSYETKKSQLLIQRANLLLKRNILKDYRIPLLEEGGCDNFLKNRYSSCQKKLTKQKSLRDKKLKEEANKLRARMPIIEIKNPEKQSDTKPKK